MGVWEEINPPPLSEGRCPAKRDGGARKAMTMRKFSNLKREKPLRKKLRNSATIQEIILWSRLRKNQLKYKFRRQYSIGKYIVDFYRSEKKLITELDGWQHKEEKQERYDKKRTEFMESLGFKILRFWNNDVNDNLEGVILKIEEYL